MCSPGGEFFMAKYSKEFKLKVVLDYLDGKTSCKNVLDPSGTAIISDSLVLKWTEKYRAYGEAGLERRVRNNSYSKEFKQHVVQEYLSGAYSYFDLAIKYQIPSDGIINVWVLRYTKGKELNDYLPRAEVYHMAHVKTTFEERLAIVQKCLESDKNYKEIAFQYGVSYTQVYQWTQKYLKDGEEGLLDRRGKRKLEESLSLVERQERRIKQLEQLTQKLQRDNEILKKVRALEAEMLRSQGTKK